jgi:hypothetical protein
MTTELRPGPARAILGNAPAAPAPDNRNRPNLDTPLAQAFPACLFPRQSDTHPGSARGLRVELHLARLEAQTLTGTPLIEQAAYFGCVDGQPS